MTRIAHLSDIHLDGSAERRFRFLNALDRAAIHTQHLILTGDLTAAGLSCQFDELSKCLRNWSSNAVTIVPGNHDGNPNSWTSALAGPLRRFKQTSTSGSIVDLGDAIVVAISTQIKQPPFLAKGVVNDNQFKLLDILTRPGGTHGRALIIAMHHGPQLHPLQVLDGLVNRKRILNLLQRGEHIFILAGHDHRIRNLGQIFTAGSVAEHNDPLRLYDVIDCRLIPIYQSIDKGKYFLVRDYAMAPIP